MPSLFQKFPTVSSSSSPWFGNRNRLYPKWDNNEEPYDDDDHEDDETEQDMEDMELDCNDCNDHNHAAIKNQHHPQQQQEEVESLIIMDLDRLAVAENEQDNNDEDNSDHSSVTSSSSSSSNSSASISCRSNRPGLRNGVSKKPKTTTRDGGRRARRRTLVSFLPFARTNQRRRPSQSQRLRRRPHDKLSSSERTEPCEYHCSELQEPSGEFRRRRRLHRKSVVWNLQANQVFFLPARHYHPLEEEEKKNDAENNNDPPEEAIMSSSVIGRTSLWYTSAELDQMRKQAVEDTDDLMGPTAVVGGGIVDDEQDDDWHLAEEEEPLYGMEVRPLQSQAQSQPQHLSPLVHVFQKIYQNGKPLDQQVQQQAQQDHLLPCETTNGVDYYSDFRNLVQTAYHHPAAGGFVPTTRSSFSSQEEEGTSSSSSSLGVATRTAVEVVGLERYMLGSMYWEDRKRRRRQSLLLLFHYQHVQRIHSRRQVTAAAATPKSKHPDRHIVPNTRRKRRNPRNDPLQQQPPKRLGTITRHLPHLKTKPQRGQQHQQQRIQSTSTTNPQVMKKKKNSKSKPKKKAATSTTSLTETELQRQLSQISLPARMFARQIAMALATSLLEEP